MNTSEETLHIDRVLVIGGPKVGKTTLGMAIGKRLCIPVMHCDSLIDFFDWSGVSKEIADSWMCREQWIIEGCAGIRALRKRLIAFPTEKPCELIVYVHEPFLPLSKGQASLNKGVGSVWNDIKPLVEALDIKIVHLSSKQETEAQIKRLEVANGDANGWL
jgi:hypothetical protein